MNELIDKIFSHPDFPSHPRKQIGTEIVKGKEQPVYSFFLDQVDAYTVSQKDVSKFYTNNEKVYKDCVCIIFTGENGPMRYVFWFSKFNVDDYLTRNNKPPKGEFEMLMMGTEKI